jgi:hypothetical protein
MPERIQLRRTKGWRKPEGAIVVSRPSYWANNYRVGAPHPIHGWPMSRGEAVALYRDSWDGVDPGWLRLGRKELAGHDLACWCPLDEPCHADVLLELANATEYVDATGEGDDG